MEGFMHNNDLTLLHYLSTKTRKAIIADLITQCKDWATSEIGEEDWRHYLEVRRLLFTARDIHERHLQKEMPDSYYLEDN